MGLFGGAGFEVGAWFEGGGGGAIFPDISKFFVNTLM